MRQETLGKRARVVAFPVIPVWLYQHLKKVLADDRQELIEDQLISLL